MLFPYDKETTISWFNSIILNWSSVNLRVSISAYLPRPDAAKHFRYCIVANICSSAQGATLAF